MQRMMLIMIMALMVFFGAGKGFAAPAEEVEIISSDAYGLILELTLPPFEIHDLAPTDCGPSLRNTALSEAPGDYQRIILEGWARTSRVGHPDLPVKAMLIQVPPSGAITMEILEEQVASLPGVLVSPVPPLEATTDGKTLETYLEDEDGYCTTEFFPASPAQTSSRQILRDTALVRIMLHPFRWNPASRELRYATHLRLGIHFENPLPERAEKLALQNQFEEESGFDQILQRSVANYRSPSSRSVSTAVADQTTAAQAVASSSNGKRLRIEIREDGIYRISHEDLVNAGFNPGALNPRLFR
jgi:hypothetical protein